MSKSEKRSWSPAWLEHSGLPGALLAKSKSPCAWAVFKKIVELDCERNANPGTVEISLEALEARCGVSTEKIRKVCPLLRKQKLVAFFLPDNDEEAALFRVVVPLQTPRSAEEIKLESSQLFQHGGTFFRYVDVDPESGDNDLTQSNHALKEVVDLYFDVIGLKMNAFILDELRMLPEKFDLSNVRSVFAMARKNEIRSLRWVIQELVRRKTKTEPPLKPEESLVINDNKDEFRF